MRPFGEGVAAVRTDSSWQLIDKNGQLLRKLPADVTDAGVMSKGLLPVCLGGKWGYMNREGEMVIAPNFAQAGSFVET